MHRVFVCCSWLVVAAGVFSAAESGAEDGAAMPPAKWLPAWQRPSNADRPLQIVHGIDPRWALPEGIEQVAPSGQSASHPVKGMRHYLDYGLGGIVCNVAFQDYLRSEEHWKTLVAGLVQCEQLGLVVWLYDEEGYPSGSAGGLVLAENHEFEAQELAYDASREDPFLVRASYEFTHANNNYHAARRYANLLDDRATQCFIAQTHVAYWQRLRPFFGKTIQAFFTDEPSLLAVNLGQIPEPARSRVRVVDPPHPDARPLPAVPWSYDLALQYRTRYGEDLLPQRKRLFSGDAVEDRRVRRQFWALIADLIAERYFGGLQQWCGQHGVAASGHTLWEEALIHHVALEGNGLQMLTRMDIPGLDVLTSDPEAVIHGGWMTAGLPCSAATLCGRRRVMTEVSDFSQKMGGAGPAGLADMQATAAWQATWGVTEFTLYYGMADRTPEIYRNYCDYVGRLNALLKPADRVSTVLLYYPIHDLWSEYRPVAEPLKLESQSPRAQTIVKSFLKLGQNLQRGQIPFTMIDHSFLAKAVVGTDGSLSIGSQRYAALVLPQSVELPPEAAAVAQDMASHGGQRLDDQGQPPAELFRSLRLPERLVPSEPRVALGRFHRDGRTVLLLANVGRDAYQGHLSVETKGDWCLMSPADGRIVPIRTDSEGRLPVDLGRRSSLAYVQVGNP